jgi:predicted Rossmann fold nucleotide-binding protein DprA/Smf involved in DNA uptake
MIADAIGADTQAVLLLTASLGKRTGDVPKPLLPSEYSSLAEAMREASLRPADLLGNASAGAIEELLAEMPAGKRGRIAADRVVRLLERGGLLSLALTRWTGAGLWVVSRADAAYPSYYKRVLKNSAPPIVFGIGPQGLLERGGVAVVGSRKPEPSSAAYTEAAGRWAAASGMQVVSGAARGVDELAMLACADVGGTSLGVVAESLLQQSTRRQFRDPIIGGRLTLISSFDPEAPFSVGNAMARNRWIYALADRGLVVACSKESGGTWAGAIEALRRGFPVYARRGNPDRPGNEALIEHGARPIEDDFSLLMRDEPAPVAAASALQVATSIDTQHHATEAQDHATDPHEHAIDPHDRAIGPHDRAIDRHDRAIDRHDRAIDRHDRAIDRHDRAIDPEERAKVVPISEEIYAAVAPMLLRLLREPLTAKELVERTEMPKILVARWLKRLVDERRATKAKTRYQAADLVHARSEQPSLFQAT